MTDSSDSSPKFQPKALITLLWKYRLLFLRYWKRMALGILALLVTNLLAISIPWLIKHAVETLQHVFSSGSGSLNTDAAWMQGIDGADFTRTLCLIALCAVLMFGSRVASRIFLLGAGRKVECDIRNRLYHHLLGMPTDYYAAHPPGELMSRMTSDVEATKYLAGPSVMLGVNTLFAYLTGIPMMLFINWPLALATFVMYPVMIRVMTLISRKVRRGYLDVQEILADISTVAQENLNGMAVIQSYVREEQENKRFHGVCDRYFNAYTSLIHERILLFLVLAGLSGFSMLMVLLVGGGQVIAKNLDWGGFVAFTMVLEHLAWPTMALGWTINIFQQGTASLERIDDVLSTESALTASSPSEEALSLRGGAQARRGNPLQSENVPPQEIATAPLGPRNDRETCKGVDRPQGAIRIENLRFAYRNPYASDAPKEDDAEKTPDLKPVLDDVSLEIMPGETIALVGPVGSGKSTLLRLLPRIYESSPGTIFLDNQDITTMDLTQLRASMVFMPQTSFLFSSTVSQNIAFGQPEMLEQPNAEMGYLAPAAEVAAVHADIERLPKRYDTLVGERGLILSGGQRQRVALARTLMMEAPVLVLDDPFSNIDAETERAIVTALRERKVFHHRTTLIATHRFALIALCDRVALMEAGRIVAVGTPEELLATQPLYQKLHQLQQLRESLGAWTEDLEGGNGKVNDPLAAAGDAGEDEA